MTQNTESNRHQTKGQILIIDDTPANLRLLTRILVEQGYKIRATVNGSRALSTAKKESPDLILLDIMMPDMDGFEVCKHLKNNKKTKDIPIIFLSALSDLDDKVNGFNMGAVDYITKPFQVEEVLARVETHLSLRNATNLLKKQAKTIQQTNQRLQMLNDQLHHQLALAQQIQLGLLLPAYPNWTDINVVCYIKTAHEIGGDFYHYYNIQQTKETEPYQRYGFIVGDISGKGVSAALLMAATLSQFDASLSLNLSLSERLVHLDSAVFPYMKPYQQNCAMCYIELDLVKSTDASTSATLRVVNAGCIPPYIKKQDGSVQWLKVEGIPLGMGIGTELVYNEIKQALTPGDIIIMMSDGIAEAKNTNQAMFGFERLQQVIQSAPQHTPQAILTHITEAVAAFMGEAKQQDDMAMVVIQV